jgi:hypothetical protein
MGIRNEQGCFVGKIRWKRGFLPYTIHAQNHAVHGINGFASFVKHFAPFVLNGFSCGQRTAVAVKSGRVNKINSCLKC